MPTFTTIALENLLEPRVRDSYKSPFGFERTPFKSPTYYSYSKSVDNNGAYYGARREELDDPKPPSVNHVYISPALYITPEPAPIPEVSAGQLSPSPYVVNHKRRGEHLANRKIDGFQVPEGHGFGEEKDEAELKYQLGNELEEELVRNKVDGDTEVNGDRIDGFEGGGEEFFNPACDVSSAGSASEGRGFDCRGILSGQTDFFDAVEEFSSEGSLSISNISLCGATVESELHTLKLKLLEETEKRKAAEDSLTVTRNQWLKIRDVLSQEGLTLPSPSDAISGWELDQGSIEQLVQELAVARFVAEAIGKGQARAEAELASEAILEPKNQEISRLKDRLQYYEAVNHEMSQRNQEIVEAARKQRQRKRTQQRWLWSSLGFSAVIGVSLAAYIYLPQTSSHQPTTSSATDSTNPSRPSSS